MKRAAQASRPHKTPDVTSSVLLPVFKCPFPGTGPEKELGLIKPDLSLVQQFLEELELVADLPAVNA